MIKKYNFFIISAFLSLTSIQSYAENISYQVNQFTEWDSGFCSKIRHPPHSHKSSTHLK